MKIQHSIPHIVHRKYASLLRVMWATNFHYWTHFVFTLEAILCPYAQKEIITVSKRFYIYWKCPYRKRTKHKTIEIRSCLTASLIVNKHQEQRKLPSYFVMPAERNSEKRRFKKSYRNLFGKKVFLSNKFYKFSSRTKQFQFVNHEEKIFYNGVRRIVRLISFVTK